jgi:hypothetical protein
MIYFIHDVTNRAIKIGCGWNPRRRLSTLQISTSNKLDLLGTIAGMEKVEAQVHELVCREFARKPGESYDRPLRISGEWFDDRILPFVMRLIASPKEYLDTGKKPAAKLAAPKDPTTHECKLVLAIDSGEQYHEPFILKAASPDLALAALGNIAQARLPFLANAVQITALMVRGCTTKKVSLRGAFASQKVYPREGLQVAVNSRPDACYERRDGVKLYALRWLHGVPDELCHDDGWRIRPTAQFQAMLAQFAKTLSRNQCVICAKTPLAVMGVLPREILKLPKGELRSKVNQKAASKRKRSRSPSEAPRAMQGIVYFIQDTRTLAVKIGFCLRKPEKRLAALQTGNANPLRLLGHVAASSLQETQLHAKFAPFHLQGEWFSSGVVEAVEGLLKHASVDEWLKAEEAASQQQTAQVVAAETSAS